MGMAASQARYLALVARKSNCEYEGQQINQARTVLSNQSANLFNQMLGLSVPVPPSTQDFTKMQYSFTDGINESTIDSWQQLASPEEDYNYVINYHYNADVYTGSQKKMNDPKVQFSGSIPTDSTAYAAQITAIQEAQKEIADAQADYDEKLAAYQTKLSEASKLQSYADSSTSANVNNATLNDDGTFTVSTTQVDDNGYLIYESAAGSDLYRFYKDGNFYIRVEDGAGGYTYNLDETEDKSQYTPVSDQKTYTPYASLSDADKQILTSAVEALKANGALEEDFDLNDVYYDTQNQTIAFESDLGSLTGVGTGTKTLLPLYYMDDPAGKDDTATWKSINGMNDEIANLKALSDTAKARLDLAQATFDAMSVPSYIGNCELNALSELTEDQMAEIAQVIKDMQAQGIETNLTKCFDTLDGTYNADTYSGGIYSFTQNGVTYYTTYYDLAETANSGTGINHIDNQQKLAYYNATYVSTKIEKTEKALLETDGQGRFTSVRIGDDTITYTLNMETITDDVAYQDAMNQYYYESAQYDKMVQDINAKTSLIQQEDQQLELRLKQLDTEQNALSTEIDAVSKVVKDNVEDSFKTFGG